MLYGIVVVVNFKCSEEETEAHYNMIKKVLDGLPFVSATEIIEGPDELVENDD